MKIELIDLTGVTRDSDKLRTTIYIHTDRYDRTLEEWIRLGQFELRQDINPHMIIARGDATDFEHDAIYLLRLPIIGLTLDRIAYGATTLEAYIHPDVDPDGHDFGVPPPGYNPMKLKGVTKCHQCKGDEAHVIVPEGNYTPKFNPELYEQVRGKKITIHTGFKREHDK